MDNPNYFCLKCLAQGDEEAFVALYGKYHRMVYFAALKMLHSEDDAKDVTQTVFMKVWEHRGNIKPEEDFEAYIGVICRNVIFDLFKKEAREAEMKQELALTASEADNSDEEDFKEKYYNLLHEAIGKLPPQRRKAFEICKLQGYSYDRAASKLGVSRSAIHDHIVNANKFIREYIGSHGDIFTAILVGLLFC